MLATLLKQPADNVDHALSFSAIGTPTSVAVGPIEQRGAGGAIAAAVLAGPGGPAVRLSGGSDGCTYLVPVIAEDASGRAETAEIEVQVMDLGWSMPDGGAPMLTIAEFVARFGLPEVVRMTDGRGDGRIDKALLVAELVNAQAVTELHIAGRVTIASPAAAPTIVKKIIGDLARAALYPSGPPDGVAEQARASTRLLERIQSGALGIGTAEAPVEAGSGLIVSYSGGRAYADGLADYPLP